MIVPNRLTFVPQAQQQQKDSRTPCCSVEKRAGLMDDLLAAAETVLTRVSSPAAEPSSGKTIDDETPYRKKTKSHHTSGEPSPEVSSMVVIHQQAEQTAKNLVTGLQKYPSGLDVLADQAFASSSQNRDETISNGLSSSLSSSPCSKNQTATPPQAPILYSSELSEVEPEGQQQKKPKAVTELHEDIDPSLSKLDRTTDKSQAGPEKSSEARKKIRSPYLKWNSSEDEMLVKAVSKYGLRWESVSRCVPSRSYHQCRQRWLRGLKGGENLPDDLQSYYPAIQVALKLFNVSRKKSIAENEPGVELEEEYEEEEGEEEGETADTVQSKLEIEKDKTSYDEPKNRVNLNEKLDEPAEE
ncbi:hypothetical protein BY996DRAFT_463100 [Phakopsora pachyrhizi]|nr:hypothetical protein BY996DRAFT_463100 [Phakopsora pachyrhizi]